MAIAVLLALTPVIGRHLLGLAHQPLTGIDHLGALCLVALHQLVAPLHVALHLLVGAGLVYAVWERARVWRRARRALAPLDGHRPVAGDPFWQAAAAAGLSPSRLRIVDGLPTPAFTAGWWAPLVYVARELGEGARRLPPDELVAVIAHEHAHVRRRDPLRFSVLRAIASVLFWMPALRALADDVIDEAEVLADDAAARVVDPLTLAGTLVALARWRSPVAGPGGPGEGPPAEYAVGFLRRDLLDRRVRRLVGEERAPDSRLTRRSVAGAALALAVVWVAGVADLHELPHDAAARGHDVAHATHCHHLRQPVLSHLFCRWSAPGGWITRGGEDCPHREQPRPATPAPRA